MSEPGPAMKAYEAWHLRYPLSRALPISNPPMALADAAIAELEAEREEWDSFDGHMRWLEEHWPARVFDGSSGDEGPLVIVATRALAAEREAWTRFAWMLDTAAEDYALRVSAPPAYDESARLFLDDLARRYDAEHGQG